MAVIKNRKEACNQELEDLQKLQDRIQLRMTETPSRLVCTYIVCIAFPVHDMPNTYT